MTDLQVDVWCSVVAYHTSAKEIEALAEILSRARVSVALTIIDNSNSLTALCLPEGLPVELLTPDANLGYGRGHNLAIDHSRGRCRYHLVLNSDITFDPTVIDTLSAFMDMREAAGLVMPLVRYPDGSLQHLCRLLPNPLVLIGRRFFSWARWARLLNKQYELHSWAYDEIANFPFLSGCFMFIRRKVLDEIGGFDPRYFLYAEDLDLSRRIHMMSETLFFPYASITHEYRSQKRRGWRQWLYAIRSLSQYFCKWGWIFDEERERVNREVVRRLSSPGSGDKF